MRPNPMIGECAICCNDCIVKTCGAQNSCSVKVCDTCFDTIAGDDPDFQCHFCKCIDYKRHITCDIEYYAQSDGGDTYSDKSYVVLNRLIVKNLNLELSEDCWAEMKYCFECF